MVKYVALGEDGTESYFLAEIFEPLPFTGEAASVTAVSLDGVTADGPIPTGSLSSSSGSTGQTFEQIEQIDIGLIGGGEIAGGFGQEQIPTDENLELFEDEDILEQLRL